jgi:DNA-directed RNA polymerase subunit alpha
MEDTTRVDPFGKEFMERLGLTKDLSEDGTAGTFVLEPLPRGYGVTLGNALRRVIISSISGFAITHVRIDGVFHEFSTMKHVMEDTPEILFNLRKVRLVMPDGVSSATLRLSVKGEKKVTAADFEENTDVSILDPEGTYICTLTSKEAKLELEAAVSRGNGFVEAINLKKKDPVIGLLTLDAKFTPVESCAYEVENTRVGSDTNFDRVIVKVVTNGTKSADRVFTEAALELNKYYDWITNEQLREERALDRKMAEEADLKRNYMRSIDELELAKRAQNCLEAAGIKTIGQLLEMTAEDLLKLKSLGEKSLVQIVDKLGSMGLYLKEE